jgi:hypothetical protein
MGLVATGTNDAPQPTDTIVPMELQFSPDREVWEQQPEESDRAYSIFSMFRDTPVEDRALTKTYRAYLGSVGQSPAQAPSLGPGPSPGPTPKWYINLASLNRWHIRSKAYDTHVDRMALEALTEQRIRTRLKAASVGTVLMQKVAQAIGVMQTVVYQKISLPDGTSQLVQRSALSPREIASLAKVAKELQWAALGMEGPSAPSLSLTQNNFNVQLSDADMLRAAQEIVAARSQTIDVIPSSHPLHPSSSAGPGSNGGGEGATTPTD